MSCKPLRAALLKQSRKYGFNSSKWRAAYGNLPGTPDKAPVQKAVLEKLENFDSSLWSKDPVQTVINGAVVAGGKEVASRDAFNRENGKMIWGDAAVLDQLKTHLKNLDTSCTDYRVAMRKIEDQFVSTYSADLIANQAMDFFKQDGFTEIEEWVQASTVERRLNDDLLGDEMAGTLTIKRDPAFVGCVSNFSNFLDLCKKVIRNMELGVPVVVLSRTNTTQHMYRWFQRLQLLMAEHGVPAHMATYASLDVAGQRELLTSMPNSPMFFTGSREVAAKLKEVAPNLMSATSGPNTMVCTAMTDATNEAVRISSTIENAGQCTHIRHLVAPQITEKHVEKLYDATNIIDSPIDAVKAGFRCDGMLKDHPTTAGTEAGYTKHPTKPAAYTVRAGQLPPDSIDEKWRQSFLDVTSVDSLEKLRGEEFVSELADWLVRNGPITLAVNGDEDLAMRLFEKTSMTVYTIGTTDAPGLNVSARPQEGEPFGEFPARPTLSKFTKFPVLVPSSSASYHSSFTSTYLQLLAKNGRLPAALEPLKKAATNDDTRGYLQAMYNFLQDACGVRCNTIASHARTAVSGWQRPPINGQPNVVRIGKDTSVDAASVYLLPYLATNAKESLYVSCDPSNTQCTDLVKGLGLPACKVETEGEFEATQWQRPVYNVQYPTFDGVPAHDGAPMVGSFLLLLFPVGHVKCLNKNDNDFAARWSKSPKWLSVSA